MIKHALAGCAVIGLLAAPLSLAAAGKDESPKSAMKGRVPIVAASRLLDKTVYDKQGRTAGEIEYLLIDPRSGELRYALASLDDADDDRLTPIPWRAFAMPTWSDGLRVRAEKDHLAKGKRYSEEELAEFTQPTVMTSVVNYWAPVMPADDGAPADATDQSGKRKTDDKAAGQAGAKATDNKKADTSDKPLAHILVGREFVTTLLPAEFRSAEQIEGSGVVGAKGEEFGEIEELMIDPKSGRVAYVQVSYGGFLGLGEEVTPVPLKALAHSAKDNTYVLQMTEKDLEKLPRFSRGEPPRSVRRQDLSQLYEQFNVEPYWTQSAQ